MRFKVLTYALCLSFAVAGAAGNSFAGDGGKSFTDRISEMGQDVANMWWRAEGDKTHLVLSVKKGLDYSKTVAEHVVKAEELAHAGSLAWDSPEHKKDIAGAFNRGWEWGDAKLGEKLPEFFKAPWSSVSRMKGSFQAVMEVAGQEFDRGDIPGAAAIWVVDNTVIPVYYLVVEMPTRAFVKYAADVVSKITATGAAMGYSAARTVHLAVHVGWMGVKYVVTTPWLAAVNAYAALSSTVASGVILVKDSAIIVYDETKVAIMEVKDAAKWYWMYSVQPASHHFFEFVKSVLSPLWLTMYTPEAVYHFDGDAVAAASAVESYFAHGGIKASDVRGKSVKVTRDGNMIYVDITGVPETNWNYDQTLETIRAARIEVRNVDGMIHLAGEFARQYTSLRNASRQDTVHDADQVDEMRQHLINIAMSAPSGRTLANR